MSVNVFHSLCEQLGYEPENVVSIRVNVTQVVIVTRNELGQLSVTNHEHTDRGLGRAVQGPPFAGSWDIA